MNSINFSISKTEPVTFEKLMIVQFFSLPNNVTLTKILTKYFDLFSKEKTYQPNLYYFAILSINPFIQARRESGHHINTVKRIVSAAVRFVEICQVPCIQHVTLLQGIWYCGVGLFWEAANPLHETNQAFVRGSPAKSCNRWWFVIS